MRDYVINRIIRFEEIESLKFNSKEDLEKMSDEDLIAILEDRVLLYYA